MDEELIEAENQKMRTSIKDCIKEIDFAIKFAESRGVITLGILNGIKKRLLR